VVNLPRRWPLAVLPTPLVPAERWGRLLGHEVWVKRDDLTGFVHSGNKARPLEFLIEAAVSGGHDHVVGCGGPTSNLCAALAAAAATAGLRCSLVFYGEPSEPSAFNEAAARAWGAAITYTGSSDRAATEPAARSLAADLERDGHRPYVVPRGGATSLGAAGFAAAADEVASQWTGRPPPRRVVIAAGSGASAGGLLAGLTALDWDTMVVAAAVSRPADETRERILELAEGGAAIVGAESPDADRLVVIDAIGPGFGRADPEGDVAADIARRTEGLLLDATYTAKAAAVLCRLAREAPEPTLFWHTGGLAGAITELTPESRRAP
jgi:1-aminocyclopropane-1-carboxylate deaminase/D-cysteine desulfhydrase-like pyridoxal-dependent ACC family enzyme